MQTIVKRLKGSWFWVNKVYFFIVLLLSAIKSSLFLTGFIVPLAFYIRGILKAKVPIEHNGTFQYLTYKYKEVGNTFLKLDIWYPNLIKHAYPLIFFAHGGGWISGFRNQPNNVSWCKFLPGMPPSCDLCFDICALTADIGKDIKNENRLFI